MVFGLFRKKKQSNHNAPQERSVTSKVLRYSHLPGIIPRIRELGQKFGHFAYMLALIYRAVNLLPANHPYLNPVNIGQFGLRDVIAAAANNVQMKRENIDQIAVFGAVIMSVVLIAAQFIVIGANAVMGQAKAATFFDLSPDVSAANQDFILVFIDQVFGDVGVIGTGAPGIGTPLHAGLHEMLAFYSMAMLILAVFIVIYYIITVIGEAAVSGTPFGRRFNSLWAPIRLVVALGLLVPVANGLNSAQYITLYTAKMGSNLASNAWSVFVGAMTEDASNVLINPDTPNLNGIVEAAFLAETCRAAFARINGASGGSVNPVVVYSFMETAGNRVTRTNRRVPMDTANATTIYNEMTGVGNAGFVRSGSSINFSWPIVGSRTTNSSQCGDMSLEMKPFRVADPADPDKEIEIPSSREIHIAYMQAILNARAAMEPIATQIARTMSINNTSGTPSASFSNSQRAAAASAISMATETITEDVTDAISLAYSGFVTSASAEIFEGMAARGWGGAALYYARLGKVNQTYGATVTNVPTFETPVFGQLGNPDTENLFTNGMEGGTNRTVAQRFFSSLNDVQSELDDAGSLAISIINQVQETQTFSYDDMSTWDVVEGAADYTIVPVVNWIFGINALYDFKDSAAGSLDPMMGIMSVGDAMVTRSLWMFTLSALGKAGQWASGFANIIPGPLSTIIMKIGAVGGAISGLLFFFGLVGLAAGLLLYYMLPLMPFVYFMFAVVSWIMEIFEAIVAVPLWALAHLKIDGDGLPGPLAINGYYLLLGILLRPVLIVFGLIGGYIIFGAGAYLLAHTFDMVTAEVRGGDDIGAFGRLIYVIIFVYISYSLGLMCFKMVDTIPRGILRWIGQGGATPFSDEKPEDPFHGSKGMIFAAAAVATQAGGFVSGQGRPWEAGGSDKKIPDKIS